MTPAEQARRKALKAALRDLDRQAQEVVTNGKAWLRARPFRRVSREGERARLEATGRYASWQAARADILQCLGKDDGGKDEPGAR